MTSSWPSSAIVARACATSSAPVSTTPTRARGVVPRSATSTSWPSSISRALPARCVVARVVARRRGGVTRRR
ncbi:MAG: hypothetical protein H6708_03230 [Kofleriaceae bacterium]|nr:hypothetical protein [Kofleriaceae bacterium]